MPQLAPSPRSHILGTAPLVNCRPLTCPAPTVWSAQVLAVSRHTIQLLLHRRFERGTILEVKWDRTVDEETTLLVRVASVEADAGGQWLLQCGFTQQLSDEERAALL